MNEIDQLTTQPWIKRIPASWGRNRLANVADILFSNVDKHTLEHEIPVELCNYVDVYRNGKIDRRIAFMEASAEDREIRKFQLRKGDVLVTKDSESPDDIAIGALVADELPGVLCGYHLAMIRPQKNQVSGCFLAWLFADKSFRGHFEAHAVGVTRFGLSQSIFRSARVPLPPLSEQSLIAAYLDASCAAIDAAVTAKRKQIETLDALEMSLIHDAVTKGLCQAVQMSDTGIDWNTKAPSHWRVRQIKRMCSLVRGQFTHRPRNDPALYDGPYPFIQTGDITAAQKYIRTYAQTLNELGLSASKQFPKGTLVMSIAANIGDVAILDFEACFPDSMVGLIPTHETDLHFLYYLMRAMRPIMLRSAVLSTQLNLNYVRIGVNFAAFPPKDEQVTIARHLDEKEREVQAIKSVLQKQIDTLTAYRKSLIHECVTGQRRITEATLAGLLQKSRMPDLVSSQ